MNKIFKKEIILAFVMVLIVVTLVCIDFNSGSVYLTYNQFLEKLEAGSVTEVTINETDKIDFKIDGEETVYKTDNPRKIDLKEMLLTNNVVVNEANTQAGISMLLSIAFLILVCIVLYKNMRRSGAFKGAQKQADATFDAVTHEPKRKLNFQDVAGNDEAKDALEDIVDFLKNPDKYSSYGARMPRGIIFYGPPGTGKTLMAKALAGEAGVPFYAVSGSDFVQMYVGVGASRIRELFAKAKENDKAVIFIDEIDALAKKRASSGISGNEERDQTLNALLTEMSGFNDNEGIIVVAATNRLDVLDEAVLRPGRFDRHIEIGLPDKNAREKILLMHGKNKPIDEGIDIKEIAEETVYFSGAMLENLLNEAAIFAAKKGDKTISKIDIDKAFYTVIAGSEKKDRSGIRKEDREVTAYHEAGHALVTKLMLPENIVSKVTIIPSTKGAGGFSMNIHKDKMYATKKDIENQIKVALAGRAAEEIIFGKDNITTGASNDIEKATSMITNYITKYGMSEKYGLINLEQCKDGEMSKEVLEESMKYINGIYAEVKDLIIERKYYLNKIAEALLHKESLNRFELDRIMEGEDILASDVEKRERRKVKKVKDKQKIAI